MTKKAWMIAAIGILGSSAAHASLIGTSVTLSYYFNATVTTDVFTVTNAVEITCPGSANLCSVLTAPTQTIDVGASSILYTYTGRGSAFNASTPNRFDFENLSLGTGITTITLFTDIDGLDLSRVTFSSDSVQVDMHGLTLTSPQDSFLISLNATPEPGSFWGIAGSLLVGGYVRICRKRERSRVRA